MRARAALPLVALLAACRAGAPPAPAPTGRESPEAAIAAVSGRGPLAGAQWGVLAVELATGDTVLARNEATRFLPASTMKIATAVAALDLLGPAFRWRTELWSGAAIDSASGTLPGDLVLPGTGDPTLSPRFHPDAPGPLERLGTTLRDLGVRRVTGALVVDASSWDSTTVRGSWMMEDLPFDYGATGGAFVLNEGETHVELRGADRPGDPPAIDWWPMGEAGFVVSRIVSTSGVGLEVSASYLPESRVLSLAGTVPAGAIDTVAFATRDPVRQSAAALYRELTAQGAVIDGGWRVEWSPGTQYGRGCAAGATPPCSTGRVLGALVSPPLTEVVEGMLGPSQNWVAEQIVRTLGAAGGARASWPEGTRAAVDRLESAAGVDRADIRMVDGSGISTQNLLTPRALVEMLRYARSTPWGDAFRAALPEPGSGTMSNRLLDLRGRLSAKTGSMTNVGTLAGYLVDDRGRELAFAVLVNASNVPAATTREGIDRIVRALAARR